MYYELIEAKDEVDKQFFLDTRRAIGKYDIMLAFLQHTKENESIVK
ncbi:15363_t:CDS:1, partial [Funneliformis caledonium]